MKILHLLTSGGVGGIETLVKDYSKLSDIENIFIFTYKGGDIADEMVARGDTCEVLNHSKKAVLKTYRFIDNICKTQGIAAIVVQPAAPVLYMYAIRLKKKFGLKFVAYAHSDAYDMVRFDEKNAFFRKVIMTYALKKADGIVAISEYVKSTVTKIFNIDTQKVKVIFNGVDIQKFNKEKVSKINDDTLNIIYVGRLIKEKGVQILIEAISQLKDMDNLKCKIVGSGPFEDELKTLAVQLNVMDKVEFLGQRRDVENLLTQADVFIHAALWQEGFGITIVEAMAAGKICICSDCGAIPEIIDDGVDGFLFKQGDIGDLASRISKIGTMSLSEITGMSDRARKKTEKFDIKVYVSALDGYISELAN